MATATTNRTRRPGPTDTDAPWASVVPPEPDPAHCWQALRTWCLVVLEGEPDGMTELVLARRLAIRQEVVRYALDSSPWFRSDSEHGWRLTRLGALALAAARLPGDLPGADA